MNTQGYRDTLIAKNHEIRSRQICREDIAVEKHADAPDELQQNGDRVQAFDSVARNWQMSSLISDALARIEHHTYGLCADCSEQISEKRLAALPWAKYCIGCQDAADRANASLKDAAQV
jgi:RNA polymerase-binding transcription factor DksA